MTEPKAFEVLDPTSEAVIEPGRRAARLDSLDGKCIALYQNGKLNAKELMDHVEELLRARYRLWIQSLHAQDFGQVGQAVRHLEVLRTEVALAQGQRPLGVAARFCVFTQTPLHASNHVEHGRLHQRLILQLIGLPDAATQQFARSQICALGTCRIIGLEQRRYESGDFLRLLQRLLHFSECSSRAIALGARH